MQQPTSSTHSSYMQRALSLAARGKGRVSPNPCVGCVIVRGKKVVGEGFHGFFGGPHAEIEALKKMSGKATGATVYLTLEPCTHWGKTPPCAPELIRAGVKEVFISMLDPNPLVAGNGVRALKKAGIKVHVGLEREANESLNRSYFTWRRKNRPHVVLKMAQSLDGKTATVTGDSKWISSSESRALVHRLRAESDAILVGARTAALDNPTLTSHGTGRNPLRIVLDPKLKTPQNLALFRDKKAPTWVLTDPQISSQKIKLRQNSAVQILRNSLKLSEKSLKKILIFLSKNNVSQLLVEGGGETAGLFMKAGLVDEFYLFVAPLIIGGKTAPTSVDGRGFNRISQALKVKNLSVSRIGPDVLFHGRIPTRS